MYLVDCFKLVLLLSLRVLNNQIYNLSLELNTIISSYDKILYTKNFH